MDTDIPTYQSLESSPPSFFSSFLVDEALGPSLVRQIIGLVVMGMSLGWADSSEKHQPSIETKHPGEILYIYVYIYIYTYTSHR